MFLWILADYGIIKRNPKLLETKSIFNLNNHFNNYKLCINFMYHKII